MFYECFKEMTRALFLAGSLFIHVAFAAGKPAGQLLQKGNIKKRIHEADNPVPTVAEMEFPNISGSVPLREKFKLVLNEAQSNLAPPASEKKQQLVLQDEKAIKYLKTVLRRYKNRNLYMKITKKNKIAALNKETVEEGSLYWERTGKFRIAVGSQPASLLIFDGSFLWYQPDREEKLVLKFKAHPQIELFSSLFDHERFFNFFSVFSVRQKQKGHYSYILSPKEDKGTISKIILSCGKNINGLKILWQDLGNWQHYAFSKLWFRKQLSGSLFVFNIAGFEVLEGNIKPKAN